MSDITLRLGLIGPPIRNGPWISWKDKAVGCGWTRRTELPNIIWFRLMTIKWRRPPIKVITCFTSIDEEPEGET